MRIFVINLEGRADRRNNVIENFANLGVDYEFFSAVEGPDAARKYFAGKDVWACLMETGRTGSPNEMGCYASHLLLWKKCIELNEPIVIMEDDLRITRDFIGVLNHIEGKIDECGFIRLEAIEPRWGMKKGLAPVKVQQENGYQLLYQRMPSVKTTGYAISPGCAAALIENSTTFTAPVDHVLRRFWIHKQPLFAVSPAAVGLADEAAASSMTTRRKSPFRHLIRPFRVVYRLLERRKAILHAQRQLQSEPLATMLNTSPSKQH